MRATKLVRMHICSAILHHLQLIHLGMGICNNNLLPSNIFVKLAADGVADIKFVDWYYFSKPKEEVSREFGLPSDVNFGGIDKDYQLRPNNRRDIRCAAIFIPLLCNDDNVVNRFWDKYTSTGNLEVAKDGYIRR